MISRAPAAALALAALLLAGAASVALDVVAPGAGPLVQPLSSFAHTPYAWLWRVAVGAGAAALVLLAAALRDRATSPAFTAVLAAAGLGLAAAGACAADRWFPWERPPTLAGGVHAAAVLLVLVAFASAMALRARDLPQAARGHWDRWSRACEVCYAGALVGAVVYLSVMAATDRPPHLFGLWERLALGSALAWSGLLAAGGLWPRSGARAAPPAPAG